MRAAAGGGGGTKKAGDGLGPEEADDAVANARGSPPCTQLVEAWRGAGTALVLVAAGMNEKSAPTCQVLAAGGGGGGWLLEGGAGAGEGAGAGAGEGDRLYRPNKSSVATLLLELVASGGVVEGLPLEACETAPPTRPPFTGVLLPTLVGRGTGQRDLTLPACDEGAVPKLMAGTQALAAGAVNVKVGVVGFETEAERTTSGEPLPAAAAAAAAAVVAVAVPRYMAASSGDNTCT